MSNLQKVIEQEAHAFARNIVAALRGVPLNELVGLTGGGGSGGGTAKKAQSTKAAKGARPAAKSSAGAGDAQLETTIIALVRKSDTGMRVDEIKKALGISDTKKIQRPIAVALEKGRLTRMGERRGTTYFAK